MKSKNINRNNGKQEIRLSHQPTGSKFEVRTDSKTGTTVTGRFASFNVLSHDLGFREKLLPGCFTESLKVNPVRCLVNHDPNLLIGRTESGTLKVWESDAGLEFRVQLPKGVSYSDDLAILLERGDSYECSFSFVVPPNGDSWSQLPDGTVLREINTCLLSEGSILLSPAAYPDTQANLRSLPKALRGFLDRGKLFNDDDDSGCDPDADDDCEDSDEDREGCSCRCELCSSEDDEEHCYDIDDGCMIDDPDDADDEDSLRSLKRRLARAQKRAKEDDTLSLVSLRNRINAAQERARISDLEAEGDRIKAFCLRRLKELDAKK